MEAFIDSFIFIYFCWFRSIFIHLHSFTFIFIYPLIHLLILSRINSLSHSFIYSFNQSFMGGLFKGMGERKWKANCFRRDPLPALHCHRQLRNVRSRAARIWRTLGRGTQGRPRTLRSLSGLGPDVSSFLGLLAEGNIAKNFVSRKRNLSEPTVWKIFLFSTLQNKLNWNLGNKNKKFQQFLQDSHSFVLCLNIKWNWSFKTLFKNKNRDSIYLYQDSLHLYQDSLYLYHDSLNSIYTSLLLLKSDNFF